MKWRKIKLELLAIQGIIYRAIVIIFTTIFFVTGLEQTVQKYGAIGASLIWSSINMTLYYLYHFVFLKLFKMGV